MLGMVHFKRHILLLFFVYLLIHYSVQQKRHRQDDAVNNREVHGLYPSQIFLCTKGTSKSCFIVTINYERYK